MAPIMNTGLMRRLLLLLVLIISACTQNSTLKEYEKNIDFCRENLPEELTGHLKKEFFMLESYFIQQGLLKDRTGESYFKVYKTIAETNTFKFQSQVPFKLLDSLSDIRTCIFKLLTEEQLAQVTQYHLEAANKIKASYTKPGDITPASVAEKITKLLGPKDFDLEFFRINSLLSFYEMSKPVSLFPVDDMAEGNYEILDIVLTENNTLMVLGKQTQLSQIAGLVGHFIRVDPVNRAVVLHSSRKASYEVFVVLLDSIKAPINALREGWQENYSAPVLQNFQVNNGKK